MSKHIAGIARAPQRSGPPAFVEGAWWREAIGHNWPAWLSGRRVKFVDERSGATVHGKLRLVTHTEIAKIDADVDGEDREYAVDVHYVFPEEA